MSNEIKFYEYAGMSYEQASREAERIINRLGWFRAFDRLSALRDIMRRALDAACASSQPELAAADAALIAKAAPDMLAALQGVVHVADRATVEFDAARAAIAKATSVPVI